MTTDQQTDSADRTRSLAFDNGLRNLRCAMTALQVAAEGEPDADRLALIGALHADLVDLERAARVLARF
ncbi:MAG: hypothetical protein QM718_04865 [Steroidobacteraceae bacterium]